MNKEQIKISLIIVTYNSGRILKKCLESVNIFFPDDEIIVVDNHPDNKDILDFKDQFDTIHFISNPVNNGFGAGNNLGVLNSHNELLFFLNPDTVVEKFDRKKLIEHYSNNKDSITGFPLFFPNGEFCKPLKFLPEIDFIIPKKLYTPLYKRILKSNRKISRLLYISGAALMIRKELFLNAGMFDENYFLFFEENDLRSKLKKLKKYNPWVLSHGFKIIHHEGKSYNTNAISWYTDSLIRYAGKHHKKYLLTYKKITTTLSLYIGNLRKKDGESKRILINELKKR